MSLERWGENGGWSQLVMVTLSDYNLLAHLKGCEKTLAFIIVTNASDGIDESLLTICSHDDGLDELRLRGGGSMNSDQNIRKVWLFAEDTYVAPLLRKTGEGGGASMFRRFVPRAVLSGGDHRSIPACAGKSWAPVS